MHDVAVPGRVDHPDRHVAEGLLVELVGGDQPHRQVEAVVGDPRADALQPRALGVADAGRADDQVDALGDHRRAHVLERPEPAHAAVLRRALGADPADDVVGADAGRVELGDEVRRELARADDRNPGLEALLEPHLDPCPERRHEPGAEDDRLVLGRRVRAARRERDQPRRGRAGDRARRARAGTGWPASGAAAAASARSPAWRRACRRTRSAAGPNSCMCRYAISSGCGRRAEPEREPVDHPLRLERADAPSACRDAPRPVGAVQFDRVHQDAVGRLPRLTAEHEAREGESAGDGGQQADVKPREGQRAATAGLVALGAPAAGGVESAARGRRARRHLASSCPRSPRRASAACEPYWSAVGSAASAAAGSAMTATATAATASPASRRSGFWPRVRFSVEIWITLIPGLFGLDPPRRRPA